MGTRKTDITIGQRAYEELLRICGVSRGIQLLGCSGKRPYEWREGSTPDAKYLARLHHMGADVIYILTGERKENDNR